MSQLNDFILLFQAILWIKKDIDKVLGILWIKKDIDKVLFTKMDLQEVLDGALPGFIERN